uniref:NTP transferase domain-containing protein n=1 Tax=Prevotella sp. GTC17260 TaxID=3236796 RepID=A0AB33JL78_9BACT
MNAIIMAAGTSSRFVPLSWECPKGLLEIKGEILIERQIRQLHEAGIKDITIVTGYMADKFEYLKDKFRVSLVHNPDYARYNNTSTLMCVLDKLQDTWLCSSDNYFTENVFLEHPAQSQYAAEYAEGSTEEYCLAGDMDDNICEVTIGGANSWYMIGHVYFSKEFSEAFKAILMSEYGKPETRQGYWEDVYIKHIDQLPKMKLRKFEPDIINEFDSLEELRNFDVSYKDNTRSSIMKAIANKLNCQQSHLMNFGKYQSASYRYAFTFNDEDKQYLFLANHLEDFTIQEIKK